MSATEIEIKTALARSAFYKLLAKPFLYPTEQVFTYLQSPTYREILSQYRSLSNPPPEMEEGVQTLSELLASGDGGRSREALESEYNRLFAHLGSAKSPPYETEYGYENVFQKTEAMADIAGFYNAFGLEVSEENTERVDFISMELEFMSYLALKEAVAIEANQSEHIEVCRDAQRKFLQDHLGRWARIFAEILLRSTANPFYVQVGKFLQLFVAFDSKTLGVQPIEISAPPRTSGSVTEPFACDGCHLETPTSETQELSIGGGG